MADNETNGIDQVDEEVLPQEQAAEEAVETRLKELESELSTAKDRHLRLAAEFDNYRKRVMRDQADNLARAQSALIARLIDVLDDLDRVAHHSETSSKETLLEGVELVEKKFRGLLEGAGLERIDAADTPFDPAVMEALTTVPTDDPDEDNYVDTVFAPGYKYQGMLVRPARVVVKKFEG